MIEDVSMTGPKLTEVDLERLVYEGAVKLEITGGIPTWEASPSFRHQWTVYLIQGSIKPSPGRENECACIPVADVYLRFPDGSLKRPDISLFFTMPPIQDEALEIVPRSVVEIISPGYEFKDLTLNPQFYLSHNVEDVVVVDPRSGVVTHHQMAGSAVHQAPITIDLQCGCQCTIPKVGDAK